METLRSRLALSGGPVPLDGGYGRLSLAEALDATPALARGVRIATSLRNPGDLLRVLCAYDGHAGMLTLLSPEMGAADVADFAREVGADAIVSDRQDIAGAAPAGAVLGGATRPEGGHATGWLLATSGTTGRPKLVEHSLADLSRTVLAPGDDRAARVWGLVYDATRFAGLQVVLQSLLGGGKLVAFQPDLPFGEKLAGFARHGVTHMSATPTLWRRILMHPASAQLKLRQATLGGEIADQLLLTRLAESFPETRITHIYASTELGVGFSVKDGRAGFPDSWLETPLGDITLRIRGGKLWIRAAGRQGRYFGAPGIEPDADGFFDTQDMVDQADGRVRFLGRSSGLVNVGGAKVFPEAVENILNAAPQVAVSKVGARRNPFSGAILVAEVVPTAPPADAAAFKADLLRYCRERLAVEAVPAMIVLKSDLAVNASGKLSRS